MCVCPENPSLRMRAKRQLSALYVYYKIGMRGSSVGWDSVLAYASGWISGVGAAVWGSEWGRVFQPKFLTCVGGWHL